MIKQVQRLYTFSSKGSRFPGRTSVAHAHSTSTRVWILAIFSLLFLGNVSAPKAQAAFSGVGQESVPGAFTTVEQSSLHHMTDILHTQREHSNNGLQNSDTVWSEPIQLFQAGATEEIREPVMISDPYGNVHVFWNVSTSSGDALSLIYYTRLDASGWTAPVDIIAADTARSISATISSDGFIYLIWNGAGGISYSRAPVQTAEFVQSWSDPVFLTSSNLHANIITSPSGNIYLAFPGEGNSGIFEQVLEKGMQGWSSTRTISLTSLLNTSADYVQMRGSEDGTLHAVWTEFYHPAAWPPIGVFYSQSKDDGYSWSTPLLLAGDGYDLINLSVLDDNTIHVAWLGMAGVGGRYHRWSADGGQTWSEINEVIPAGLGGTEGLPQLMGDEAGTVHLLTTRAGLGCPLYTYFKNQKWAQPVCISEEKGFTEEPALTISEGNKLHAVFWVDRKRLWYTTKSTDAPWIPPMETAGHAVEQAQNPVQTITATALPVSTAAGLPASQQLDTSRKPNISVGQILILSAVPAVLLIMLVVALQYKKNR